MTREEAKHIVDVAFGVPQAVRRAGEDRTYHEDEIREAKKMAIKALEQEPKFIAKSDGTIEQIKNCNNCKYGYLSSICKKPNTEICGNSFSQWKPYKAESEDKE